MPTRKSRTGSELFIVDNSEEAWKVLRYLHDWCQISKGFDIATAYFEISALLALNDEWQKVDEIRILMGDQVSLKTKRAFDEGLGKIKDRLDASLEDEKLKNAFLQGVPAVVQGLRSGKIRCRVYRKDKFHAKAYITHARQEVVGSFALVGSSNFTRPGITENVELNVQIAGTPVAVLQEWYDEHWELAEDVTPEILKVIERHVQERTPFEIYAKALLEFFRGHELTADEWEKAGPEKGSRIYPLLDQYQKDGYHALLKIGHTYRGGFLCDGVGLGKTYIGLMLLERLIYERKRVALFVPKSGRKPVWEKAVKRHLGHLLGGYTPLLIFNHTDLSREQEEIRLNLESVKDRADAIIIDEAHHFRNPGIKGEGEKRRSRYREMYDLAEGKELYLLTATPVNNRLIDLQHMIELFSRKQPDYFKDAPLAIHSLPGHFRTMENELERLILGKPMREADLLTDEAEAEQVLFNDSLFKALVVQRSRAYVKKSLAQHGGSRVVFPVREDPKVVEYSLKKTYQNLLDKLEEAFHKKNPLFTLAMYYPLFYLKGDKDEIPEYEFRKGRQKMVVGLIRTQFLKRFESSVRAFELSCENLLEKLLAFATRNSTTRAQKDNLERWRRRHDKLIQYVHEHQLELFPDPDADPEEDFVTDEMLEGADELNPNLYKIDEILADTFGDLDQIIEFIGELKKFKTSHDDKLKELIKLLKSDPVLKKHKVIIFSEFLATGRYLRLELRNAGFENVEEVDSQTKVDRGEVIRRFAPYYNDSSSKELEAEGVAETRILISTDVLAEGLNLQDATRLINYDLHWNPVRLMQRIGRVDRRLDPEIEKKIVADHPDQKKVRGTAAYWNFLPPKEINRLLTLYTKVTGKVLKISMSFGIEGRKLLHPDDEYEALKNFNHDFEGEESQVEKMHLEYHKLLQDHPDLEDRLKGLPLRVFSGKEHLKPGTKAVFFCYALPGPEPVDPKNPAAERAWTEAAGMTKWYLFEAESQKIEEEPSRIVELIRSTPETPRHCTWPQPELADVLAKVEKHIKNTYFKAGQAPVTVKPVLKAWMELS